MLNLRQAQNNLLHCHAYNSIIDEELILLYDVNKLANTEFPYWTCLPIGLEKLSDNECKAECRFPKNNILLSRCNSNSK